MTGRIGSGRQGLTSPDLNLRPSRMVLALPDRVAIGPGLLMDRAPRSRFRPRSMMAWATWASVALGLLWRTVRYALAFPLWGDEAFVAVNFLTRDLGGLARPLEFDQIASPGFLWIEWLVVRWLGSGECALRLVPYLAGMASLLLFWRFCRTVASRRVTLLAVATLAASVYPVRHANEVKPYAVDLLVSLIVTMLGWGVWRAPQSARRWWALIGASAAGVWCSYPAVFPAASVAMVLSARLVARRTPRRLAFGVAYACALGASFLAVVVTFAGPQARAASWLPGSITWKDAFPPLAQPWRLPWWLLDIHAGAMMAYPHGGKNFASTATLLLVVVGAWSMWRRRARRPLLMLLLGPLPVALAAAALHRYPYGTSLRVMIYMAPAFCLLVGEGCVDLFQVLGRGHVVLGPVVVAGLLSAIPLACSARDLCVPYTRWDDVEHRRIARMLADRAAPGDRWIVFNGATPPPWHVPNLMITRWIQRVAEVRFYLLSYAPVPARWEPDLLEVTPMRGGRTWLIIHFHGSAEHFPHERLEGYRRTLVGRLGEPRSMRIPLPDRSFIEVLEFPAAR